MSFATKLRPPAAAFLGELRSWVPSLEWVSPVRREYLTADVSTRLPMYKRALFLKLPPQTALHRHVDVGDCVTEHIVIYTNPHCWNFWEVDGVTDRVHMEEGEKYLVNRLLPHWAVNGGLSDRIHLLLES